MQPGAEPRGGPVAGKPRSALGGGGDDSGASPRLPSRVQGAGRRARAQDAEPALSTSELGVPEAPPIGAIASGSRRGSSVSGCLGVGEPRARGWG